jgi:hypothetical protein
MLHPVSIKQPRTQSSCRAAPSIPYKIGKARTPAQHLPFLAFSTESYNYGSLTRGVSFVSLRKALKLQRSIIVCFYSHQRR